MWYFILHSVYSYKLRLKYFLLRDIALALSAFGMKRNEPYLGGTRRPEIHVLNVPRGTCANKLFSVEGDGGGMVG